MYLHVVDCYAYIDPMGYVYIFTKIIGPFYWRLFDSVHVVDFDLKYKPLKSPMILEVIS